MVVLKQCDMAIREQELKAHSIDGGTEDATKLARQPDKGIGVRRLRALDTYDVGADRLQVLEN